ncbi:MAG TPA: PadR family transcriptional regulator [Nitrososphaeraceae archaeon]|nr:PadR family transcriptional regulator [Nitrososphaeraceae archaeon]
MNLVKIPIDQNTWTSIVKNYEMIEGAQLSNSFIILMALNESNKPLNSTEISEIIALKTSGKIFKVSATLKDSLEHRLKRGGYVDSTDIPSKKGTMKPVKKSLYSITPKGRELLKGWISFLNAYKSD